MPSFECGSVLPAPVSSGEGHRLQELHATQLLDAKPNDALDHVTRRASQALGVPIALVSLVDEDRQWFASRCGLDASDTPRDVSFCGHAIHHPDETFVVEDATQDERFFDNPLVTGEPQVTFYAGRPIRGPGGQVLGTLCVIDHIPRTWSAEDDEQLRDLARWTELEIRAITTPQTHVVASDAFVAVQRERFWDVSQDMFAVATPTLELLDANGQLAEHLGYPLESMLGRSLFDIVHPLDDARTRVFLHEVASAGTTAPFVIRIRCVDGTFRHIEWTCAMHGGLFYAAARDVTERERNSSHIQTINKALADSNRDLREFAAFTAHELRGPLRTIAGFVTLIERMAKNQPDMIDAAQRVVGGTRRMDELITNMLELASISSDDTPHEAVEVDEIRRFVVQAVHAAYPNADIEWDDAPAVTGHINQLQQLFLNIVENAAKYQRPGNRPAIRVATGMHAGRVRFSITDNGVGIPNGLCSEVFEPFRRAHSRDEFEGTGIGLAMCKKIVRAHGGCIQAFSDPGIGSTFVFDLPAHGPRSGPATRLPDRAIP